MCYLCFINDNFNLSILPKQEKEKLDRLKHLKKLIKEAEDKEICSETLKLLKEQQYLLSREI